MARELSQIMSELDSAYKPQQDLYNKQISGVDPALEAEQQGLQAQKEDSFRGITEQANRRGLFYSGVPIAEQARYTGGQFLPALANLRGKYFTQKNNLTEALNQLGMKQQQEARGIREYEVGVDTQAAQFAAQQKAQLDEFNAGQAARAQQSAAGSSQFQFGSGGNTAARDTGAVLGASTLSLRQTWQNEANGGDWEAQTLLNFVGDDNKFNGYVNNQSEYDILKRNGVQGNYSVRQSLNVAQANSGGLTIAAPTTSGLRMGR